MFEHFGWYTPSAYGPRGIIARPEKSMAGNIVLRCGNELSGGGWSQSVHVVLSPAEAADLCAAIQEKLDS